MKQTLQPTIHDVRSECVIVQAWKKTVSDIRARSWYSDTLEIDYQSLRLPKFIAELQERLNDPSSWTPAKLELVPAPKNQQWSYTDGKWVPPKDISKKMRPLAHVQLEDQVVATALMLCLADRVESKMGDPRLFAGSSNNRQKVLAYGHRVFCDSKEDSLQHRWGSSKLYRQFYQDYRTFLERPNHVIEGVRNVTSMLGNEIAIVHADLSKFYDKISPALVHEKASKFCDKTINGGEEFQTLLTQLFDWRWSNVKRAKLFSKNNNVESFEHVALPQGLTASGFFANIVLSDFEDSLKACFNQPIEHINGHAITLLDACYYVDDFRIVLSVPKGSTEDDVATITSNWLQGLLDNTANGLVIQPEKTKVTIQGRDKRFLVSQSKAASRIQKEVSGTFDMLHGSELIGAIEGFFHTQKRYPEGSSPSQMGRSGLLVGMSDMRDDTAARFAAGKYLRTYRLLRPLLGQSHVELPESENDSEQDSPTLPSELTLSKKQLDEKAKLFAALLIEEWIINPANVRLLRVALNIYPDVKHLDHVLELLEPAIKKGGSRAHEREVQVYCLTELFRAGATETGIVHDNECLPANINLDDYHGKLTESAIKIFESFIAHNGSQTRHPWYLMQQVFLYLSARNAFPESLFMLKTKGGALLLRYRQFALFLDSQFPHSLESRSLFLGIATTAFNLGENVSKLAKDGVSSELLTAVVGISPEIGSQLWQCVRETAHPDLVNTAGRLGLKVESDESNSIAALVGRIDNPFTEDENLLELAVWLLALPDGDFQAEPITPWHIECTAIPAKGFTFGKIAKEQGETFKLRHFPQRMTRMFTAPSWCETLESKKKYNVGLILRYAIRGTTGLFSNSPVTLKRTDQRYTKPISHWEQQRYSTYQGRSVFGPPWLPISSSTEDLLFQLLRWPGCGLSKPEESIKQLLENAEIALRTRKKDRGEFSSVTFLNQRAPWPDKPTKKSEDTRPLRIGIVQSVIPNDTDYGKNTNDPQLNEDSIRQRQRSHLASLIDGVGHMLRVRETHRTQERTDGRIIDLLIFPELAVHPSDIDTIILPFVRTHRCIVLFGQVYHPKYGDGTGDLINSGMWLIPKWDETSGLQVERIEQGKQHLAPMEMKANFNPQPVGFRPAQWLIQYEWSRNKNDPPLTLSASICYDATDLGLAADLKSRSDLYIVCALNRDVGTFDRMSEGLHYHMYQGVVVVNNGHYGGSNFFMPLDKPHQRQIFHVHGQSQASISFAEISPQKLLNRRAPTIFEQKEVWVPVKDDDYPSGNWKSPPAPHQ